MGNMDYLNALKTATDLKDAWGDIDKYHRWLKRQYKKHAYVSNDKLEHSLGDGTMWQRFHAEEDGKGWYWYGFVLGEEFLDWYDVDTTDELSDSDITEWFEGHMAIRIYSDYDCTGKSFTRWIDWHRNPDGSISYVHSVGIDV